MGKLVEILIRPQICLLIIKVSPSSRVFVFLFVRNQSIRSVRSVQFLVFSGHD